MSPLFFFSSPLLLASTSSSGSGQPLFCTAPPRPPRAREARRTCGDGVGRAPRPNRCPLACARSACGRQRRRRKRRKERRRKKEGRRRLLRKRDFSSPPCLPIVIIAGTSPPYKRSSRGRGRRGRNWRCWLLAPVVGSRQRQRVHCATVSSSARAPLPLLPPPPPPAAAPPYFCSPPPCGSTKDADQHSAAESWCP